MTQLLVLREQLKKLYGKYEVYLIPVGKFLTALITFLIINGNIGYMEKLAKFPIALILALLCSFLPLNFIMICGAGLSLLHVYELSMECALIVGIIYLLMFLLYFRFSPKDTFVVLLTPICCVLQIPYAIPLALGLVGTPASVVSVGCGVIVYHILKYIKVSANALTALDAEGMAKFKYLIDGILGNKEMFVMIAAFVITLILVYVIRRMNIDYAWTIAMIVGGLADILILLIGDLMYTTNISIIGVILGSVVAFGIVKVLQFFVFNVDYARTERVQFEDDEYYYFVKAVPKVTISTPEIKVKKVSGKTVEEKEPVERKRERVTRTVRSQGTAGSRSEGVSQVRSSGTVSNGMRTVQGQNSMPGSTRTLQGRSSVSGSAGAGTSAGVRNVQSTAGTTRSAAHPTTGATQSSSVRRTYSSEERK